MTALRALHLADRTHATCFHISYNIEAALRIYTVVLMRALASLNAAPNQPCNIFFQKTPRCIFHAYDA